MSSKGFEEDKQPTENQLEELLEEHCRNLFVAVLVALNLGAAQSPSHGQFANEEPGILGLRLRRTLALEGWSS